jgi:hypothetical protein
VALAPDASQEGRGALGHCPKTPPSKTSSIQVSITGCFFAVAGEQSPQHNDVDVFAQEPDGAVTQDHIDATGAASSISTSS